MVLRRNDPCHCGSGKKYKKCHLDIDRDAQRAVIEAWPVLQEKATQRNNYERRLRDEYGVYINYVSPVAFQGGKVWAIGSRVYPNRRANETFHEFLLDILRGTFGEEWRAAQAALPDDQRHFVLKCSRSSGSGSLPTLTTRHFPEKATTRPIRTAGCGT